MEMVISKKFEMLIY